MMSRDSININHRNHFVGRMKSLVLGLAFCHIVCLEHQRAVVVVDAWSPKVLSFSTHRHPTRIAFHDRTDQGNSNRITQATNGRSGRSIALAASEIDDSDDDEPKFLEVESLTPSQVTELIELSFFQACFALSKGDVDPLKLFIVAVMTASKKYEGASAKALVLTVDALSPSVRPLEPQERELREIWIKAIYLVMGHVLEEFNNNSDVDVDDDDEVTNTYGPILVDLVAIHKTGMGLNANQFVTTRKDILLPKENVLVLEDGPEDDDLVKLAVVTQTINVLFTTLVVLQEEDSSDDGSAAGEVAPSSKPTVSSSAKKKKKTKSPGKGFG